LKEALVLFAHGSRDPEWARPFESIASLLSKDFLVTVAYLDLMRPSLAEAVAAFAAAGVKSIRIVPLFFAPGGHVKEDLPRLVSQLAAAHHDLELRLEKPIGEQPEVIAAIPGKTRVGEVMTANPRTITPDRPFGHALHLMYEGEFRHVPVVENGRPLGMVSARDALGPDLEQFVAELDKRTHIGEILG
jgi:sirohydrochlorin cobaltochelatase